MTEADYFDAAAPPRCRVFLGQPHCGQFTGARSSLACFHYTPLGLRHCDLVCPPHSEGSSNLPLNFNVILANALGYRDAGLATHLAILHEDVSAEPGWLDTLWLEMLAHEADFIGAVVPIKEPNDNPRTSTGVGKRSDIFWGNRCLRMSDIASLPETFGRDDVCGGPDDVLIVNTGCFLADLRRPWWDDRGDGQPFAFGFENRVRLDRATGVRTVDTCCEDWLLSHMLHDHGARVFATSKVRATHWGDCPWHNAPTGQPAVLRMPPIPDGPLWEGATA